MPHKIQHVDEELSKPHLAAATSNIIVMKFGGTSVRDADQIKSVSSIIQNHCHSNPQELPVVVLSAMGKTTDLLITAAKHAVESSIVDISNIEALHLGTATELSIGIEIMEELKALLKQCKRILKGIALTNELSPTIEDSIMSFGERMIVRIFAGYLNTQGFEAKAWDAYDIGICTIGSSSGSIEMERVDVQVPASAYPTIKRTLMDDLENHRKESNGLKYYIPVITGFIAKNDQNKICTLGRGGSDFTAALLGVSLVAREIQIWTDTDGVLTGDPRIVDEPLHIEHMAFEEAEELAYFGAKILHPRSIQAPKRLGIPIRVKNTYNPSHCGTLISSVPSLIKRNQFLLTALTLKSPVILVDIRDNRMLGQYGFLAKVFSVFKTLKISIDVIATSEVSVSISLDKDTPIERVEALQDSLFQTAEINILGERSIIALIGNKSRAAEGLEIACNTLARMNVPLEMVSLGASKLNASLIIQKERSNETVRALHSAFFNHVDRHSEKIAN